MDRALESAVAPGRRAHRQRGAIGGCELSTRAGARGGDRPNWPARWVVDARPTHEGDCGRKTHRTRRLREQPDPRGDRSDFIFGRGLPERRVPLARTTDPSTKRPRETDVGPKPTCPVKAERVLRGKSPLGYQLLVTVSKTSWRVQNTKRACANDTCSKQFALDGPLPARAVSATLSLRASWRRPRKKAKRYPRREISVPHRLGRKRLGSFATFEDARCRRSVRKVHSPDAPGASRYSQPRHVSVGPRAESSASNP